jgi:RNA polymerase sigma-54 factor
MQRRARCAAAQYGLGALARPLRTGWSWSRAPLSRIELRLTGDQRQSTTLSPRLQHAVRLLQMSSLDFAALLREKAGQNPFLELEDSDAEQMLELPFASPEDVPPAASIAAAVPVPDAPTTEEHPAHDADSDRDLWQADAGQAPRKGESGDVSALELMAVETPLNLHLHQQLIEMPLCERDLLLARAIVESLDDDGYLRTPLAELESVVPLDPPATPQELAVALLRVQTLEPAGVGARDVRECLGLQLPAIECPKQRALAASIVGAHLQALAARDVTKIARALGETPQRIDLVCQRIRHLDPRPGWRVGATAAPYVVPDVVVKKASGRWQVQLNPAVVPRMRLNTEYVDLFQRHRQQSHEAMAEHLQDARWTLRNVEQRFSTILDVADAIVRRQRHFLDYGPMAMKPLGLKEIAEEVGVHESTVSRVTNSKYMSTPLGVFELKYFFSRAMVSANGKGCSGTAIRGLVKDIIEGEAPQAPLSDAEIARQLAKQGLKVARRTVTKYRQMLKFEAVDRRRQRAAAARP